MTDQPEKPAKRRTRPPLGPVPQDVIVEKYKVSKNTLRKWRDEEGIDITDEAQVAARVEKTNARFGRGEGHEDERAAKLRKTKAEADMIEHKLAVQRGEFVSAEETRNEGLRIGGLVKEVFLKAPDELAPLLAGRPAHEVKSALKKWASDKLTELAGYQSPVKIETENQ